MALTDNLVAYYKLDESSGNMTDSVGGNTATNNSVTFTTGKINNCAVFSGAAGSYAQMASYLGSVWDNPYTVSMWVNPTTRDTTNGDVLLWPGDRNQQHILDIAGKPTLTCYNGTVVNVTANTALSTGTWYHVVFVRTGNTTGKIYVNGADDTNLGVMQSPTGTLAQSFRLGSRQDATAANYTGNMDEVGIWSRALSADEISQLFNSGAGLAYPWTSSDYSIIAAYGSYVLTGNTTLFQEVYTILAAYGNYALTGFDALLDSGYRMVADFGTYALTGYNLWLRPTFRMIADFGSYVLSLKDVFFNIPSWIQGEDKPTSTFINESKQGGGETWESITTTWETEIRTWEAIGRLIGNQTKQSSSITNETKP